jgi:hypothetical protein
MQITGGISIQGGIFFTNYVTGLPNPYTTNYTFLSGVTYQQASCVGVDPGVCLTFQGITRYIVLPS